MSKLAMYLQYCTVGKVERGCHYDVISFAIGSAAEHVKRNDTWGELYGLCSWLHCWLLFGRNEMAVVELLFAY